MDVKRFNTQFLKYFPVAEQNSPTSFFENAFTRSYFDPCFDIEGMTSVIVRSKETKSQCSERVPGVIVG